MLSTEAKTRFLHRPLAVFAVVFSCCSALIFSHLHYLNTKLIENTTLSSARQYADMLSSFRSLYTSEVVDKIMANGMIASHNYQQLANAVPLPATLSMLLGEKMGKDGSDVQTRLYSAYPFPWRAATGGLNDSFAKDAWLFLQNNKNSAFVRVEEVNGVSRVRYAVADLMREKCVACHNSHPDSPKVGWKTGDLRGILEVSQPLDQGLAGARWIFLKMIALVSLMLVVTLLVLYVFLRRLEQENKNSRRLNLQLTEEIRERQQAEEAAICANKAKSLFLANISHEIRTPMNAILGYAQILLRDKSLDDSQQNALTTIEKSGNHLLNLINGLLDIAKIESGVVQLQQSRFDLAALLRHIGDMFYAKTQQKKLRWDLYLDLPTEPFYVLGDESKLRQILINLTGNALKFTDQGFIQLKTSITKESKLYFSVSDSGMGLSEEEIAELGTAFTQGQAGLIKGGTGLGISISSRYLALMNSTLQVTSEQGKGSCFSFEVALQIDHNQIAPAESSDTFTHLALDQQLRVLILDDNLLNCEVLAQLLSQTGAEVSFTDNAEQALKLAGQQLFDLIFTDIDMPVMNGTEFLQQIRLSGLNSKSPVIAISASTLQQPSFFIDQGFAAYIEKPFSAVLLFQCLKELLTIRFEQASEPAEKLQQAEQIIWPDQAVLLQLKQAAELCAVSEIEQVLNQLQQADCDYSALIKQIRGALAQYDMDALLLFLAEKHE